MLEFIKSELNKFNIDLVSCLSLDECEITRPYLLEKNEINNGSVIVFAVPYFTQQTDLKSNISAYAISRDYHRFFKSLFDTIINSLKQKFPENKFVGFTDHSPINEIKAAAESGLGVIGQNHLLITEKYSSFIFIGEIITDATLDSKAKSAELCINCGKCLRACPIEMDVSKCLSATTQKKSELTEQEILLIKKYGCVWGCDICQTVCPYTQTAIKKGTIYSNVEFFKEHRTPFLTSKIIENMNDDEFSLRAYSWRGKKVIQRNLKIIEGEEK